MKVSPPSALSASFEVDQRVPPADYPRPAAPHFLNLPSSGSNPLLVDSRTAGINGTWLVQANPYEKLEIVTSAPGHITVSCKDRVLRADSQWDWLPRTDPLLVEPLDLSCPAPWGSPGMLQLTVRASGFAKAGWYVEDAEAADPPPQTATYEICDHGCAASTAVTYPSAAPAP
jgi:hypothetical protein